jgi:hypothetical protein
MASGFLAKLVLGVVGVCCYSPLPPSDARDDTQRGVVLLLQRRGCCCIVWAAMMHYGRWWCDIKAPSWEPQEEGFAEHSSKFPSVMKPRLNRTSRKKAKLQKVMLASFMTLRTRAPDNCLSACSFSPAATWNLHTTQPRTLLPTLMRLSISPVCCEQRIERIEW